MFCTILVSLWLLSSLPARAQDVQVTATVDADTIGAQDTLQLTITVSGKDSGDAEAPRLPRFKGFSVVGGPSVSTQFQWINGRSSSSKTFTYELLPEKEGAFAIDPVEVSAGGKVYKSQPVTVRVVAGAARPAPSRPRALDPFGANPLRRPDTRVGDEIYVIAELDRSSIYAGQQVTLYYHLYTQVAVTGLQLQENPPLTGFWVEDLQVDSSPRGTRKIINGKEYLDYVVKKQALFPNAPGKLKIPSSTFAVSAKVAGNDFFGMFGQTETVYRKTKEVFLEVKPLPSQERPADFRNAVGSFTLTSSIDKSQAATGDAVSLRVKLAGRGNLKTIPDLPLPSLPDFTTYSSKHTENVRPFEGDIIGGDKTWEHIIVPKAPGDQKIPAMSFSYFDPDREKYETISTQAMNLKVVKGMDTGSALTLLSGINKQTLTKQGTDINFIKLAADDLEIPRTPPYRSAWFYLLAGAPLLWSVGTFLYQWERSKEAGNLVLARSRKARRAALTRLHRAGKLGKLEPRRFYDEAANSLSGYLTDKFSLPELAVTGDTLAKTLEERGVTSETIRTIVTVMQECDFARFVSAAREAAKMHALADQIRQVIDTLERA